MIIFPAVDIQDGKAVRLKQGRAHESTVFSPDPVAAAVAWQDKGARFGIVKSESNNLRA